ncbi:hypothetical protein AMC83_PA00012 (plasmid) [Rhizobium phaseoli]|uniref:hypothetical protein n=1 Tax=Rhizobium phaseoli TaxID=396 RepID=UPI0007EBD138|nr:hypothetical protein [Rhizobium phaseoli]ANL74239.1 hypothetical protein AMC83_PA00012 [Rhizobium phaseoli]
MALFAKLSALWRPGNKQAARALTHANKFAVLIRDGYRAKYGFLSAVSDYDWEYMITVADLYVILHDIKGSLGDGSKESDRRQGLLEYVKNSKLEGGLNAIGDCFRFVENDPVRLKAQSPGDPVRYFETASGYWALKSMLDRDLKSAGEIDAAREIGHACNAAMFGFWTGESVAL